MKKYTITETSKILKITRQSVYRKIKKLRNELQPFLILENNTQYIKEDGIEIIKNDLSCNKRTHQSNNETTDSYNESDNVTMFSILQRQYENQITDLKEQIKKSEEFYKERISFFEDESIRKDKLLENMQILLKEQKMILESYEQKKSKWKFWKK